MATTVEPGNKEMFGSPTPASSRSRENMLLDKTKALAFPDGPVISLENFEHKGDMAAGFENSVANMQGLSGKTLQESYRAGFSQSATYHDKVADR